MSWREDFERARAAGVQAVRVVKVINDLCGASVAQFIGGYLGEEFMAHGDGYGPDRGDVRRILNAYARVDQRKITWCHYINPETKEECKADPEWEVLYGSGEYSHYCQVHLLKMVVCKNCTIYPLGQGEEVKGA